MAGRSNRFTIYDMMEAKGVFEANPANSYARDINGLSIYKPQDYPKMLYHPQGKEVVTTAATAIVTPFGPQWVGEQRKLISEIVEDAEGEAKLVAEGWHYRPKDAIVARHKIAGTEPPVIPENSYESEIDKLRRELAEANSKLAEKGKPAIVAAQQK